MIDEEPAGRAEIRFENPSRTLPDITRRTFGRRVAWSGMGALGCVAGLTGGLAKPTVAAHHESIPLPTALLERSPFVYISPLLANGAESTCHAEVWYAWLDGSVIVTVASDRWKAGALAQGLHRARIWVGDYGRWKSWLGRPDEAFKDAPHFDARAEKVEGPKHVERLLTAYEAKYPDEIANWRNIMRSGNADGSRMMIRYTPVPG